MHKAAELVDVKNQVEQHLERLDLSFVVTLPDLHGRPMGVKLRVKDGLVHSPRLDHPIPLLYLLARDQPWRGHGSDDAGIGAIDVLVHPTDASKSLIRSRQERHISDAYTSVLVFGAVEPVPEHELVHDLADQVRDAAKEVSLEYESWGPERRRQGATNMVHVEVSFGDVRIIEWTDMEAATGEPSEPGQEVNRQEATIELVELMDRGVKHRGISGSDDRKVGIVDVLVGVVVGDDEAPPRVRQAHRERMIVTAALGYLGYYGGEESWVEALGEDADY